MGVKCIDKLCLIIDMISMIKEMENGSIGMKMERLSAQQSTDMEMKLKSGSSTIIMEP